MMSPAWRCRGSAAEVVGLDSAPATMGQRIRRECKVSRVRSFGNITGGIFFLDGVLEVAVERGERRWNG